VLALLLLLQETDPIELSLRAAWARLDVRTYAQEYDTGKFSGTLDLDDDFRTPSSAPLLTIDAVSHRWRSSLSFVSLSGRVTAAEQVIFEDPVWPPGTRIRAEFSAFWLDTLIAFSAESGPVTFSALAGSHLARFSFDFTGAGDRGHEGHPALLLPLPEIGAAARWEIAPTLTADAELLLCYAKYTHPFHEDGDGDARIEYAFASFRAAVSWRFAASWSASIAGVVVRHRLRDSSAEDRHRAWLDADGVEVGVTLSF
jgi:hypothetical protein